MTPVRAEGARDRAGPAPGRRAVKEPAESEARVTAPCDPWPSARCQPGHQGSSQLAHRTGPGLSLGVGAARVTCRLVGPDSDSDSESRSGGLGGRCGSVSHGVLVPWHPSDCQ